MIPEPVLKAFGLGETLPVRLPGGQGTTWRAGPLILKPTGDEAEATWTADLYATLTERGFRVPRPVESRRGAYVVHGWTAWEYVAGEPDPAGRWHEKLVVCGAFHRALEGVPRPAFLDGRRDPWARADRLAWGAVLPTTHPWLRDPVKRLWSLLEPLELPSQLVHGDISGNILFAADHEPAVIDFSPYWRPAGFAAAVLVADAAVWEGANPEALFSLASPVDRLEQLVVRAELRRLLELDGHARVAGASRRHLEEAEQHAAFVTFLERRLTR
jgi:uncharacterized protein (TIGR02569 family)